MRHVASLTPQVRTPSPETADFPMPHRIGHIWHQICSEDNIRLAIRNATKDDPRRPDNAFVLSHHDDCLYEVKHLLTTRTYQFHPFQHLVRYEPKERIIDYAVTYPDKILINCVLNVIKAPLSSKYIYNSYSSIKGRGLHQCCEKIKHLTHKHRTGYYLQTDFKKYYSSIDHEKCKSIIREAIKDKYCLEFFDRLIDNHDQGLAIGISLGSYIANWYLTPHIDRRVMQEAKPLGYVRYMDDVLMFFDTKAEAHAALSIITTAARDQGLSIKPNARIAPVRSGISMVGYVFYPTHTKLRRNICLRMKRRINQLNRHGVEGMEWKAQVASYFGWCIHADCRHLMQTTYGDNYKQFAHNIMEYQRLKDKKYQNNYFGLPRDQRVSIEALIDTDIVLLEFIEVELFNEKKIAVKFCYPHNENELHFFITKSESIRERLCHDSEHLPCIVTIRRRTTQNNMHKYFCYE